MLSKHATHICALFFLTLFSANISAEESDLLSRWSISGFGSIGGIGTDTDAIGFFRNTSQTKAATKSWGATTDSRLGLQIDFKASETVHATVQWIARDHVGDFFEQNLEWAFLRWSPRNDIDIRAGRLGTDIYLLSDYSDVGYAYLWMRPPHEFYSYNPVSHFDGLDISKRYGVDTGYLTLKVFAGYTKSALRQGLDNNTTEAPVAGANIIYNSMDWQVRFSYAYMHILNELAIDPNFRQSLSDPTLNRLLPNIREVAPHLSTQDHNMHFISLGGAYDNGTWLIQAEAAYNKTNSVFLPPQASAYLSIGRRFADVTLYTVYGIAQSFHTQVNIPDPVNSDPSLQLLHDTLDELINHNGTDEQSVSIGLRWDFYQNIAFKAQWSHYWLGTESGAHQWERPLFGEIPDKVNVWSVGLDFIF